MKSERLLFIDSLRGIAATWVMFYHFYNAILPDENKQLYIAPIDAFFKAGHLGVYIFFVLSGFVISQSLQNKTLSLRFFLKFVLRRSVRLDIPYWIIIFMTGFSIVILYRVGLTQIETFNFVEYLTNLFYLDNLLDVRSIVAVGWTLQYEIQFYLVFALLLVVTYNFVKRNQVLYVVLLISFILSLAYWFPWFPFYKKALFLDLWFCFLLGVFAQKCVVGELDWYQYSIPVILTVCHLVVFPESGTAMSLVTSLVLVLAGVNNKMGVWLTNRCFLWLGTVSYSLYLLHPFLGNRLLRYISARYEISVVDSIFVLILVIAVTLGFVWLYYILIERPALLLSKKIGLANEKGNLLHHAEDILKKESV